MSSGSEDESVDHRIGRRDPSRGILNRGHSSPTRKHPNRPKRRATDKPSTSVPITPTNVFLYKPDAELPDLSNYLSLTIEVKIERKYITKDNTNYIKRKIWGSENYTSNSDIVCILFHFKDFCYEEFVQQTNKDGVSLFLSVAKAKKTYASVEKDGFLSRKYNAMTQFQGHSLKPTLFKYTQNYFGHNGNALISFAEKMVVRKKQRKHLELTRVDSYPIPANNMTFNMNNDPAFAYTLCNMSDSTKDSKSYLSVLLKHNALYLDTEDNRRFEVSVSVSQVNNKLVEIFEDYNYRVAEVLRPWELGVEDMANESVPLAKEKVVELVKEAEWKELLWGEEGLTIKDLVVQHVISYKFYAYHQGVISVE